jgi:hypothetical protein
MSTTENIVKFKNALHKGKVKFSYTKKNGETREAIGTLNIGVMGEDNAPKGTGTWPVSDQIIRYYDINSQGWRSFGINNLVSWESIFE